MEQEAQRKKIAQEKDWTKVYQDYTLGYEELAHYKAGGSTVNLKSMNISWDVQSEITPSEKSSFYTQEKNPYIDN
jgi:hypothetical protein